MTKYANKIYDIIKSSRDHMAAEQILKKLKEVYPQVVLATVYNNLNKLWASGEIRRISVNGMPDRYDVGDRHDHMVCRNCGKLVDVVLDDLTEQLQKQVDMPILDYDLKLLYICEECSKKLQEEDLKD